MIRIDLVQLGFPYHITYAGLSLGPNLHISTLTRILQNMNGCCATREHSTPPPCATPGGFTGWVHTTVAISHSQCAVVFSHNEIVKVLGLPEYVGSTTKSQPHTGLQRMVLNRHRRGTMSRLKLDASKESSPSKFKFMIIIKAQGIP